MAKNRFKSDQVGDGEVKRSDLCVGPGNSGSTVIAKIIQGPGISLSSTGTDAGTGDVTINNAAAFESLQNFDIGGPVTIAAFLAVAIRSTGRITRASASPVSGIAHRVIGFTIASIADSAPGYVQTSGVLDGFSGLTAGKRYYLASSPLGGIQVETAIVLVSGEYVISIGWAITASKLLIKIGEPILIA